LKVSLSKVQADGSKLGFKRKQKVFFALPSESNLLYTTGFKTSGLDCMIVALICNFKLSK
jgi:hypothetical protein